jgi:hypothetical protein
MSLKFPKVTASNEPGAISEGVGNPTSGLEDQQQLPNETVNSGPDEQGADKDCYDKYLPAIPRIRKIANP